METNVYMTSLSSWCVYSCWYICVPAEKPPNPPRWEYLPYSTQTPCLQWNNSKCLYVCDCFSAYLCAFRTDIGVSSEPIHVVDPPWSTLCKWNLLVGENGIPQRSVPAPINTHHVRHISWRWPSCSRGKDGKERDLSVIHCYPLLLSWRNPGDAFWCCTSWTMWLCWQIITGV